MAEVYDVEEEQSEIEAVEATQQQPEQIKEQPKEETLDDILPAKFRGKSAKDLAKIVADQDSMIGRQAQEVGEVRRLADELLKSQLNKQKTEEEKPQEVDFFENPQEAINKAVANNPDVLQARQMSVLMRQEQAKREVEAKHPDYLQVVQTPEFVDFVKSSEITMELFNRASNGYDPKAADYLFTQHKKNMAAKAQQKVDLTKVISESEKTARETSLNAAAVDTGGSGDGAKKVYSRAKLLEMQLRRPSEYAEFADSGELERAYREGRVR